MNEEAIKKRLDALLRDTDKTLTKFPGTLNLMILLYGPKSVQVETFIRDADMVKKMYGAMHEPRTISLITSVLKNMKAELDAGIIGSLQQTITGEVLSDFLLLARNALDEKGDGAKNVAAVLAAANFEDTIRRLSINSGASHIKKLQDVITDLKDRGVLTGSQVGIANAYLNFRNNALHAQWDKVEREAVASVLGFVEQLLVKHFS